MLYSRTSPLLDIVKSHQLAVEFSLLALPQVRIYSSGRTFAG